VTLHYTFLKWSKKRLIPRNLLKNGSETSRSGDNNCKHDKEHIKRKRARKKLQLSWEKAASQTHVVNVLMLITRTLIIRFNHIRFVDTDAHELMEISRDRRPPQSMGPRDCNRPTLGRKNDRHVPTNITRPT